MSEPERLDRALLRRFPLPHHPEDSDKEDRGRLLVIAGSRELPGAALLAGIGGLRAGAGKLQIATVRKVAIPLGIAIPEARVIGCAESKQGCLSAKEAPSLVRLAKDSDAVTIGCGLQYGPPLDHLLDVLLSSGIGTTLVLDAAVLGSLGSRATALRAWQGGAMVLPHSREMARMLECDHDKVLADPLAAASQAAARYNVVALIKGEWSHIVAPDGRAFCFQGGGVGLATSGSGDSLAGIAGGLCARGADPLTAALWAVYLHGEAGRALSTEVGRIGFLARELLDLVPGLMEA